MRGEFFVDRQRLQPSKRLGKGGEGEVFALGNDSAHAIKLYTIPNPASLELKVRAMVQARLAQQAMQVAFPLAPVTTPDGRFAGFLMRLVSGHKPLHELYSPGSRKIHFPRADYRFLVRVALNFARAVVKVHQLGCVIGDINHSSLLISGLATVTLIDSDSFQISDGAHHFLCRVGVPEYTPPELQGLSLASVLRTPNHDAFGLAVVIFLLLFMGRHPYMGKIRRGESPSLPDAIKGNRFVFSESRDVGMDRPPATPALSTFPRAIAEAFERAFTATVRDKRPAATEWVAALEEMEKALVRCAAERLHWYPNSATDCPWCAMESALGATLFIPYIPLADTSVSPVDPGAHGFDLFTIWRQIAAITLPDRSKLTPSLPSLNPRPSNAAKRYRFKAQIGVIGGFAVVAAAIGLWIYAPQVWFFWVVVGGYGLSKGFQTRTPSPEPLLGQYKTVANEWGAALDSWYARLELQGAKDLYETLLRAKSEYENLANEKAALARKYAQERRGRQLYAFLDKCEIRTARIKGIGPAKLAALLSYAIETAADIHEHKVLAVPGFGPATSQGLLDWRRRLESRFAYSTQLNDMDRQELAKITATIHTKASQLRCTLLAGASNLNNMIARTKSLAALKDNQLLRLHLPRQQLLVDLEYLGVPQSALAQQSVSTVSATPTLSPTSSTRAQQGPVTCPRCGSAMIRRTAHRGRNAGNQFWGCARYPLCKGTRN